MATLDLSEITSRQDATNAKLDAILAAIKALPSTPGGGNGGNNLPPITVGWGVTGNKFTLNGTPVNFVKGANCRPIIYYIKNNVEHKLSYQTALAHIQDVERTLNRATSMGMKVIRIYAAISTLQNGSPGTDIPYCLDRISEMINFIKGRNMAALLVLTDNAGSGFHVAGDDQWRDGSGRYKIEWFKDKWQVNYLNWVTAVVTRFKDEEGVFGFEVMNEARLPEPHNNTNADIMLTFQIDIAKTIKDLAPNRLCLPGNETIHQLFAGLKAQYFDRFLAAQFDALSLHLYSPTPSEPFGTGTSAPPAPNQAPQFEIPKAVNKAVYVGEFGIARGDGQGNAASPTSQFLALAKQSKIAGVFQWALGESEQPRANIGYHDAASMDNSPHGIHDFFDLVAVWGGA